MANDKGNEAAAWASAKDALTRAEEVVNVWLYKRSLHETALQQALLELGAARVREAQSRSKLCDVMGETANANPETQVETSRQARSSVPADDT